MVEPRSAATRPALKPAAQARMVRAEDHLCMAIVCSAASIAWFGWAHQGAQIEAWLRVGMIAAATVLAVAAVTVRRIPARPTLATDPRARRVYWACVGAEAVLIPLGILVLARTGNSEYASTWALVVVGVHLLPFVRPFDAPILRYTALACVLAAAAAPAAGLAGLAPAPTVAGAGGGLVLLGSAIAMMGCAGLLAQGVRIQDRDGRACRR